MPYHQKRLVVELLENNRWELQLPLQWYRDANGEEWMAIDVPKGMTTDFATIPWWLSKFFPPIGYRYARAAVIHDWFYYLARTGKPLCRRRMADTVFHMIMREDGVGPIRAWLMWIVVRFVAGRHYKEPKDD